jgi:hypothetical protein
MTRHVEAVGIISWVMGGLCLLGFLLIALVGVLGGLGIIEPQQTASDRMSGVLGCAMIGLPLGALGVGHVIAGFGIRRLRPWGRTLGLVLGILDILACCTFPIGTGVGIYALVILFNEEAARLFEPRPF